MRKLPVYLLLILALLLSGCGSKDAVSVPVQEEAPSSSIKHAPAETPEAPDHAPPEQTAEDVWLEWEGDSRGVWPFEQTVELLQFCGSEHPELTKTNDWMLAEAEHQISRFETAYEKGEDQCRLDGESWGSLWAYPVTTDRYLSAILIQREHMHFRIDELQPWSLVSCNFVYDKEEQRFISLEEAFEWMGIDQGTLEQEIWEYADRQNIGTYEDLSSIGFYMNPEGYPVFIIGAIVYEPMAPAAWPTFFNWDNGEIRWSGEEPMPLYLVDTQWNDLACLAGMGQYDGAAMISEEEAFETLGEIVDVQDCLSQGMTMVSYGITENIDGEEHLCIELGMNHEDQFVSEQIYAVSWYSVYCMDPYTGDWVPVGFG